MNLVIDTNIVFSALLNPNSTIGDLLLNYQGEISYFAPELLITEIDRYATKIEIFSKLNKTQLSICKNLILNSIHFVSEELISEENWQSAYKLTKTIDEDDTPFVALALEMNSKLWTGDKKLSIGISLKNPDLIFSTAEITAFLNNNFIQ